MTAATTVPVVAHTRDELKAAREALSSRDIAVVMTMGALHAGHAALIRGAREWLMMRYDLEESHRWPTTAHGNRSPGTSTWAAPRQ